jgi:hypothetical protein
MEVITRTGIAGVINDNLIVSVRPGAPGTGMMETQLVILFLLDSFTRLGTEAIVCIPVACVIVCTGRRVRVMTTPQKVELNSHFPFVTVMPGPGVLTFHSYTPIY